MRMKDSFLFLLMILLLMLTCQLQSLSLYSSDVFTNNTHYHYIPINSSLIDYKSLRYVTVGDRNISHHAWEVLLNMIGCWGSINGSWTNASIIDPIYSRSLNYKIQDDDTFSFGITKPPLFNQIYSNDDGLVTKVYSACGPVRSRKGLNYYWLPPNTCKHSLIKFTPKSLCYLLRGRSMIYIGDSLSLHHYETMVNAVGNRTTYGHTDNYDRYWEKYQYCKENQWGENFLITYVKWNSISEDHQRVIVEQIHKSSKGSVIIANWGAFYAPDYRIQQRRREIIQWVNNALPDALFIYRSSNLAHLDCDSYKVPDNIDHNPAPHPRHYNWHWQDFPLQNHLWRDYLIRYHPGKIYLNIFDIIRKRPDQHPGMRHGQDCLHYCVPGPVDTYVIIINSILYYIEYYNHRYIQLGLK